MKPSNGVYKGYNGLSTKVYQPGYDAMKALASTKHPTMLHWVIKCTRAPLFSDMLYAACGGGSLDSAAWLMETLKRRKIHTCLASCYKHAAESGQVHVLNWLGKFLSLEKKALGESLIQSAVKWHKDLRVIKWFQHYH